MIQDFFRFEFFLDATNAECVNMSCDGGKNVLKISGVENLKKKYGHVRAKLIFKIKDSNLI